MSYLSFFSGLCQLLLYHSARVPVAMVRGSRCAMIMMCRCRMQSAVQVETNFKTRNRYMYRGPCRIQIFTFSLLNGRKREISMTHRGVCRMQHSVEFGFHVSRILNFGGRMNWGRARADFGFLLFGFGKKMWTMAIDLAS